VGLALECAAENGLTGVALSTKTLEQVEGTFDLVLANILANTLIELAPLLAAKVKQRLVLAGVLVPQAEEVSAAFLAAGLTACGQTVQGEWIRLDFDGPPKKVLAKKPRAARRAKPKSKVLARANQKLARGPRRR
jgi:ribosomal protein L11 methyltransferase